MGLTPPEPQDQLYEITDQLIKLNKAINEIAECLKSYISRNGVEPRESLPAVWSESDRSESYPLEGEIPSV